jgi:acylphosphatase
MEHRGEQGRKAVRAIVKGRVQGVWYRAHTEKKARELGVAGFVRNLPDGTVEVFAEGAPGRVDCLVDWTWIGSPLSSVTAVEIEDRPAGQLASFETRY